MQKMVTRILAAALAAAVFLAGCSPTPTAQPVATPTTAAASQPAPTATPTAVPTFTPAPTATPQPLPDAVLPGEEVRIAGGGFSFTSIRDYTNSQAGKEAAVQHGAGEVLIQMGMRPLEKDETPEKALEAFFALVKSDVPDLETGAVRQAAAGGQTGAEADLSGTFYLGKMEGTALAVPSGYNSMLLVMGIGLAGSPNLWQAQGNQVYRSIVDSIAFFAPEIASACAVSPDPTYGLVAENPILIGGLADEGPQREKAFLDNLLGPKGETVKAYRMVTTNVNGLIVDIFLVTYEGLADPVEMFLTVYEYNDPTAPQGFICNSVVPFGEPASY